MKSLIFICTLVTVVCNQTQAKKAPTTQVRREHSAHVHGAATLTMAFDGLNGKVEFKAAAEGILGFEYVAKSAKDKTTFEQIKDRFESIGQFIQLDPTLNCHFSVLRIEQKKESENENHSDFIAEFGVGCAKSIVGSKIKIDFTTFPNLSDLDITVLAADIQKNLEAKKAVVIIDLK